MELWNLDNIASSNCLDAWWHQAIAWTNQCWHIAKLTFKNIFQWNFILSIYINGLVQERCNSIAHALELRLSCINPLISHHQENASKDVICNMVAIRPGLSELIPLAAI